MLQQAGLAAVAVGTMNKSEAERQTWLAAYGIGSSLGVILPFSRNQELEADRLGLMYAALAGYDPQEAIPLWRRMGSAGGGKPPEFASTHPSDETRIAELQKMMPQAMEYYRKAKGAAK
jgi:predicted Zn-dependent protease